MLILHVWLLLRRLKEASGSKAVAQGVLDSLFSNIDDSLREMGVGDLSVGRKVRGMAEAFYGRSGAYEKAMIASDANVLVSVLSRNVFEVEIAPNAPRLADYVRVAVQSLQNQPNGRLMSGVVSFPAPSTQPEKSRT